MSELINKFLAWPIAKRLRSNNNDDEHIDRLNHRFTVGLILSCVFVSSTTAFVMNRISCWLPTELKHPSYPKYIENYCYISNTYYIHSNITPPDSNEDRRAAQIGYYQWVPMLLLLMALGFYCPRLFWRSFNIRCGIDIQRLIGQSQLPSKDSTSVATKTLEYYCQSSKSNVVLSPFNFRFVYRRQKHRGNYLSTIYLLTRLMYLINSILQLILLNVLLGHHSYSWLLNINIIKSIALYGNPLLDSPYFPRVTLCDVPIREIAEIHRYTVQCALPINIFNEKIFVTLSFWFFYVILHNIFSLFTFIYQQLRAQRQAYLQYLLRWNQIESDSVMVARLLDYFNVDGVVLLRLISHNSSDLQTMKIFQAIVENKRKN